MLAEIDSILLSGAGRISRAGAREGHQEYETVFGADQGSRIKTSRAQGKKGNAASDANSRSPLSSSCIEGTWHGGE